MARHKQTGRRSGLVGQGRRREGDGSGQQAAAGAGQGQQQQRGIGGGGGRQPRELPIRARGKRRCRPGMFFFLLLFDDQRQKHICGAF